MWINNKLTLWVYFLNEITGPDDKTAQLPSNFSSLNFMPKCEIVELFLELTFASKCQQLWLPLNCLVKMWYTFFTLWIGAFYRMCLFYYFEHWFCHNICWDFNYRRIPRFLVFRSGLIEIIDWCVAFWIFSRISIPNRQKNIHI